MNTLKKISQNNILFIILNIVLVIAGVIYFYINRPLPNFKDFVYAFTIAFFAINLLDLAIKVVILKQKSDLILIEKPLRITFLAGCYLLLSLFINVDNVFQIFFITFLIAAIALVLDFVVEHYLILILMFSLSLIFLTNNWILVINVLPILFVYFFNKFETINKQRILSLIKNSNQSTKLSIESSNSQKAKLKVTKKKVSKISKPSKKTRR